MDTEFEAEAGEIIDHTIDSARFLAATALFDLERRGNIQSQTQIALELFLKIALEEYPEPVTVKERLSNASAAVRERSDIDIIAGAKAIVTGKAIVCRSISNAGLLAKREVVRTEVSE